MPNNESPYAAPGGGLFPCMYCGGRHSSRIECRLPCSDPICDGHGIPWQVGTVTTKPLCHKHRPKGGKPLPVPVPSKTEE